MAAASGKVQLVVHNVPQPWHCQSPLMHEVFFAVKALKPEALLAFVGALYASQEQFYDEATCDMTRNQIYTALADIAAGVGVDKAAVLDYVAIAPSAEGGNTGNKATQAIKWAVKFHRCRGMHVTPTVLCNGLEAPQVSSGWTPEQWKEFLAPWTA